MPEDDKVELWVERIKQAYLSNDSALTESLIDQALQETDDDARLIEIKGMIAYQNGDIRESAHLIETAMFEIGLSISGQMTLANAWLSLGEQDRARTTVSFLVEVIERVPCSMLPDLTNLLSALKEYELAIVVCRVAFARHPDDDNAVFGAAFYMHRAGYPPELVKNMMFKAVEMNPDSSLYQVNLAIVCCSLNEWDTAYSWACRLSDRALGAIPCGCMIDTMVELFQRFDDFERIQKLNYTK